MQSFLARRRPGHLSLAAVLLLSACDVDEGRDPSEGFKVLDGSPDSTAAVVAVLVGDSSVAGLHTCTGTVIEDDVVLTAAHCLDDALWTEIFVGQVVPPAFFAGDGIRAEPFLDPGYDAQAVTPTHPTNYTTEGHDVALLVAEEPLGIEPRRLFDGRLDETVFQALEGPRIVGYGSGGDGVRSGTRRSAELELLSVWGNHLQVEARACSGDSGGPLFVTDQDGEEVLAGLSSYSLQPQGTTRCEDRIASVYSRVDVARPFIRWQLERLVEMGRISAPLLNVPSNDAFTDLVLEGQPHPAIAEIAELQRLGILGGFPDGSFQPDANLTRAQFAAMLARAATDPSAATEPADFTDVSSDHWARSAIDRVVSAGLMSGFPDGTFQPDQAIPRQQVLAAMARVVADGYAIPPSGSFENVRATWSDAPDVAPWATNAVASCVDAQLLHNTLLSKAPDRAMLRPADLATRGEVASFIWQARHRRGVELYPCSLMAPGSSYCSDR